MHFHVAIGVVMATTIGGVLTQGTCSGSYEQGGNWYCPNAVQAITYTNAGGSGTYDAVSNMANGACDKTPYQYSGPIAPLNQEMSLHFRGPLQLKQLAIYAPGSSTSKKQRRAGNNHRRHGHQHLHQHDHRDRAVIERSVGQKVTATIDGQVASWLNTYSGQPSSAAVNADYAQASPTTTGSSTTAALPNSSSSPSSSSKPHSASSSALSDSTASWTRQGFYSSQSQQSEGLVFLNNHGGTGSGVFDDTFGNSLSYASTDGTTGASSPQILADCTLASSAEIVVMTDDVCSNGNCGYTRPGTVAYHGFDGPAKVYLMEFSMPDDGTSGANKNMPAVWILNADIPRTDQYGSCSCWASGCGEFDLFEILDSGDTKAKSTLHSQQSGGDSHFFQRPTQGTMTAAVVLDAGSQIMHIQVLNSSMSFPTSLSASDVNGYLTMSSGQDLSTFNLPNPTSSISPA